MDPAMRAEQAVRQLECAPTEFPRGALCSMARGRNDLHPRRSPCALAGSREDLRLALSTRDGQHAVVGDEAARDIAERVIRLDQISDVNNQCRLMRVLDEFREEMRHGRMEDHLVGVEAKLVEVALFEAIARWVENVLVLMNVGHVFPIGAHHDIARTHCFEVWPMTLEHVLEVRLGPVDLEQAAFVEREQMRWRTSLIRLKEHITRQSIGVLVRKLQHRRSISNPFVRSFPLHVWRCYARRRRTAHDDIVDHIQQEIHIRHQRRAQARVVGRRLAPAVLFGLRMGGRARRGELNAADRVAARHIWQAAIRVGRIGGRRDGRIH